MRQSKAQHEIQEANRRCVRSDQENVQLRKSLDEEKRKVFRMEQDREILLKDVNGYKSECARKDQIILNLQAQIGRICIEKGIVR